MLQSCPTVDVEHVLEIKLTFSDGLEERKQGF